MKTLAEMTASERTDMKKSVMMAIFHNFAIDSEWEPLVKELETEGMIESRQYWKITRSGEIEYDAEPESPEYCD